MSPPALARHGDDQSGRAPPNRILRTEAAIFLLPRTALATASSTSHHSATMTTTPKRRRYAIDSQMPIAVTAPEKYDLQDLVCAELALRFEGSPNTERWAEPANGEDAKLRFEISGSQRLVEIQAKGSTRPATLAGIAECLAHFPERASQGCLFERLLTDQRIVVLVMSGRCDDVASRYLVPDG